MNGSTANVNKAVNELFFRVNVMMSSFGYCSTDVLCSLFDTFCTSFYGSPLWRLDEGYLKEVTVAWRKCLRRVLGVDCRTRSRYLPLLISKPDIRTQFLCHFMSFSSNCSSSSNVKLRLAHSLALYSNSVAGDNLRETLYVLGWNYSVLDHAYKENICVKKKIIEKWKKLISADDLATVEMIKEVLLMRDGLLTSPLSKDEQENLLYNICVT